MAQSDLAQATTAWLCAVDIFLKTIYANYIIKPFISQEPGSSMNCAFLLSGLCDQTMVSGKRKQKPIIANCADTGGSQFRAFRIEMRGSQVYPHGRSLSKIPPFTTDSKMWGNTCSRASVHDSKGKGVGGEGPEGWGECWGLEWLFYSAFGITLEGRVPEWRELSSRWHTQMRSAFFFFNWKKF